MSYATLCRRIPARTKVLRPECSWCVQGTSRNQRTEAGVRGLSELKKLEKQPVGGGEGGQDCLRPVVPVSITILRFHHNPSRRVACAWVWISSWKTPFESNIFHLIELFPSVENEDNKTYLAGLLCLLNELR